MFQCFEQLVRRLNNGLPSYGYLFALSIFAVFVFSFDFDSISVLGDFFHIIFTLYCWIELCKLGLEMCCMKRYTYFYLLLMFQHGYLTI